MTAGFDNKLKVEIDKTEVDQLIKQYKKFKKYMKYSI